MSTNIRAVLENFNRAKAYFHRHDVLRAMLTMAAGLKAMAGAVVVGPEKGQAVSMIMELIQLLNRTDEVTRHLPGGLSYSRGEEKKLFVALAGVVKAVKESMDEEDEDQARERKLRLDRLLIRGRKMLEDKKFGEAEKAFAESMEYYRDENKVFAYVASMFLQAGQYKQALAYLSLAREKDPDPEDLEESLALAHEGVGELDQAREHAVKLVKASPRSADARMILSRILEKGGNKAEALAQAKKALGLKPTLAQARKAVTRLEKS